MLTKLVYDPSCVIDQFIVLAMVIWVCKSIEISIDIDIEHYWLVLTTAIQI